MLCALDAEVVACSYRGIVVFGLSGKELHYEWIPDRLSGDTAYAIINAAPVVIGVPKKCRMVRKAYVYVLSFILRHTYSRFNVLECGRHRPSALSN